MDTKFTPSLNFSGRASIIKEADKICRNVNSNFPHVSPYLAWNQYHQPMEHYRAFISYWSKLDELRAATRYTDTAFDYYDVARKLIEQTTDSSMKGYVLSNTADACVQFKKGDKALKYYAEAVKNYEKTNSSEEIARNYKSAAQIMIDFNSPNKAKSLLKKALVNAVKTHNDDLIAEINALLASVEG